MTVILQLDTRDSAGSSSATAPPEVELDEAVASRVALDEPARLHDDASSARTTRCASVAVAEDALQGILNVNADVALDQRGRPALQVRLVEPGTSGSTTTFPFERLPQRNSWREAIIRREAAARTTELAERPHPRELRDDLRQTTTQLEGWRIQQIAVRLAERRIESTRLQLDAGPRGHARPARGPGVAAVGAERGHARADRLHSGADGALPRHGAPARRRDRDRARRAAGGGWTMRHEEGRNHVGLGGAARRWAAAAFGAWKAGWIGATEEKVLLGAPGRAQDARDQRRAARQPGRQGRGQRQERDRGPDHDPVADRGRHVREARRPAGRARRQPSCASKQGGAGDLGPERRGLVRQGQGAVRDPGEPEQERHRGRRAQAALRREGQGEVPRGRPGAAASRRPQEKIKLAEAEIAKSQNTYDVVEEAGREGLPDQERARPRRPRLPARRGAARAGAARERSARSSTTTRASKIELDGQRAGGRARPRAREAAGDSRAWPTSSRRWSRASRSSTSRREKLAEVRRPDREGASIVATQRRHGRLRARRGRPHGRQRADPGRDAGARAPGDPVDPAHDRA